MEQAGYGLEIVRFVNKIPYESFIRTEDVARHVAAIFTIPESKAKAVTNVKLKRMADNGDIQRIQKGVYCHVKQTVFGVVTPNIDEMMMKSLTIRNGARIGYESGASLLNRIGLTTLLPRSVEITTNQSSAQLPEGCQIKLKKPPTEITDENWRYLQLIDAAVNVADSHLDVDDAAQVLQTIVEKQKLDTLTLIFTARRYYSAKTTLYLTDLLMTS